MKPVGGVDATDRTTVSGMRDANASNGSAIETAGQLAGELLHVEHVALLPGDALLLPEDDFSFRCSYVDYDGQQVLQSWREKSPRTPEEEDAFMRNHCPLILDGVRYIGRYLEQIKEGRRPEHAA